MINIVNRMDNHDQINASHSKGMRFWSPTFILKEFEKLAELGVSTVRISDEMFFLDKRYFEPLVDGLVERDLGLRMWAYSRVDTVRDKFLEKFKQAGIGWLALGIEAGNQMVRQEVSKELLKRSISVRFVRGSEPVASTLSVTIFLVFRKTPLKRCNKPSTWPWNSTRKWPTCTLARLCRAVQCTITLSAGLGTTQRL